MLSSRHIMRITTPSTFAINYNLSHPCAAHTAQAHNTQKAHNAQCNDPDADSWLLQLDDDAYYAQRDAHNACA